MEDPVSVPAVEENKPQATEEGNVEVKTEAEESTAASRAHGEGDASVSEAAVKEADVAEPMDHEPSTVVPLDTPAAQAPEPIAEPEKPQSGDQIDEPVAKTAEEPVVDTALPVAEEAKKSAQPMEAEEAKEATPEVQKADEVTKGPASQTAEPLPAKPVSQPAKKPKVDLSTLQTRQYLDQTVVPILLQGLSWLAKNRPEDPIQQLAAYLVEHKQEYEAGQDANVNGST